MNLRLLLPAFLLLIAMNGGRAQHAPAEVAADSSISSPVFYRPQMFDVLGYDAAIDLTKAPQKTMRGICTITIRWIGDPATGPFRFHLRSLKIDSITFDGQEATALATDSVTSSTFHYRVMPPAGVRQGDTSRITVHYGGTMTGETWGGVQSSGGTLYAMGVGFYNNYVSATQHWLPSYDHPSDKATFRGRFQTRNEHTVASNGILRSVTSVGDTAKIYDWQHDIPCATYLYTFAVDRYEPVYFGDGVPPIVVYARPTDTVRVRNTLQLLPRMVDLFERRFVPYPFEKVGYVATPTGAMEHETMISLNRSLAVSGDTISSVAAHELAHQWFGDLVSPLDFRHAWLTESFATFSEALWAEELGGNDGYLADLQNNVNSYINQTARAEGVFPLYDFPRTTPSSNYPVTIYSKGAVVVGMLRYELGDSIFFAGLKKYLTRHAYGTATTDSMRLVMEDVAGRPLGWFFDQWVLGRGWPTLTVDAANLDEGTGSMGASVHIAQTQSAQIGTFRGLPVEIGFVEPRGDVRYITIRLDSRDTTIYLPDAPFSFSSITVNQGIEVRALLRVVSSSVSSVSGATGEKGTTSGTTFLVQPNPAAKSTALTVRMVGGAGCSDIYFRMFESSGEQVLSGTRDTCEFTIPTGELPSGSYHIQFRHAGAWHHVPVAITR